VLTIPTNRPVKRKDQNDSIYKTRREKFNAVIELIRSSTPKASPSSSAPPASRPLKWSPAC
jgi:preprotein translocase subunit SecA